jgi:hypothetical protein
MVWLTNLIFNLQFQIPSLLQRVLKFCLFYVRYYSAGKNYLISYTVADPLSRRRGPPGVRGPQVNNRCNTVLVGDLLLRIPDDDPQ